MYFVVSGSVLCWSRHSPQGWEQRHSELVAQAAGISSAARGDGRATGFSKSMENESFGYDIDGSD